MHQKIMNYVNYQFRFDKREHIEMIKQEMIANLIDRYNDLINQGYSEKDAYIETVKRVGNIDETKDLKVDEIYIQKPTWALIVMITVSVLAIGGLLVSIISNLYGLLITLGSICLFATASYALYADSQHKRALEHDIDSQKTYFQAILKTYNKNYVIWSITIAIVFSSVILNLIFLVSPDSISKIVLDGNLGQVVAVFFIMWIIIFLILFAILKSFQGFLYKKYVHITGDFDQQKNDQTEIVHYYKQGYELILFIYFILTTLAIWASPISYYEAHIGGGGFGMETSLIGAIGDFPFLLIPLTLSFGIIVFMGFHLKESKVKKWIFFLITSLSYMSYIYTLVVYQNILPGMLEAKLTAIAIFFSISFFGHLIYLISMMNRKK